MFTKMEMMKVAVRLRLMVRTQKSCGVMTLHVIIDQYAHQYGPVARSRMVAKSGIKPRYQNTNDTEKYVEIANTSQRSGELKLTQSEPNVFGNGNTQ